MGRGVVGLFTIWKTIINYLLRIEKTVSRKTGPPKKTVRFQLKNK